jgi:hypothetical protein
MSDITQEEIVEIVTNFLLNSPPGEFMEVVTGKATSPPPISTCPFFVIFK